MSAGGEKQRARFITGQVVHWQDLLSSSPFRANRSIYAPLPEWFTIYGCDLVRPCAPPLVRSDSSPLHSPKIKYWFYDNCWWYMYIYIYIKDWTRCEFIIIFGHDSVTLSHLQLIVTDDLGTVLASLLNLLDIQECFALSFKNIFHPPIHPETAHRKPLEMCWHKIINV